MPTLSSIKIDLQVCLIPCYHIAEKNSHNSSNQIAVAVNCLMTTALFVRALFYRGVTSKNVVKMVFSPSTIISTIVPAQEK